MGNSSPLRSTIRNDDHEGMQKVLKQSGEGAPDLINEDYTGDCLCERTRNIQSPLHTCVAKRKPEMAEMLLQYGADITLEGRSGMTALHYAAKNGDLRMCKILMKYHASTDAEDNLGQKPIHSAAASVWAESNGQNDVLRYLVEQVGKPEDVNHRDVDERTPLHVAASWGYLRLARYLLEKGAERDAKNIKGKTPLDEAIFNRREQMMEMLSNNTKESADDSITKDNANDDNTKNNRPTDNTSKNDTLGDNTEENADVNTGGSIDSPVDKPHDEPIIAD